MPLIALICYIAAALAALLGLVHGELGDLNLGYLILGLIASGLALDRGHAYRSTV